MTIYKTQLKVTPKPWHGRTAAAVTVHAEDATWNTELRNYTRVMCPRWFKRIFGFDIPDKQTVFEIDVHLPKKRK